MEKNIAKILLDVGCVSLKPREPFTYASGLKGPIYCDNRLLLSHVEAREKILAALKEKISSESLVTEQLGGIATAGIPAASFLAHDLKKPMVYIRSAPKGHGKKSAIEGKLLLDQPLLMVEDLVNQGASSAKAVQNVLDQEGKVEALLCIVDYGFSAAKERLGELGVSIHALTDFNALCEVGRETGLLNDEDLTLMQQWHQDPENWSP